MRRPRPWSWPALTVVTLAKAVLAGVVGLALWAAVPALVGWQPTTVMTGSMLPRLHVGDIAVSRPVPRTGPVVGTVLLFDDPDHADRLRLHRLVAIAPDGRLITKGDANAGNDSSPVATTAVHGVGTLRVPWVGLPVVWLRDGRVFPFGLTLAALAGLIVVVAIGQRYGFPDESDRHPPDGPGPGGGSASPGLGSLALRVVVAVSLAGLVLGPAQPAAAFAGRTTTAAALTANPYFTCANAVAAGTPWVWYRMDETLSLSLTATDSSGNGRAGSYGLLGKTAGSTRACVRDAGTAMTFDGSTGYLSSPRYAAAPPNTFTVEIWFKTSTTRGGKLIGWGSSQTGASVSYDRQLYLTNAGAVVFGVFPGAYKTLTSGSGLNDGKWHHAAGTVSSAGMQLYVDGDRVGSDTSVTSGQQAVTSGYWRIAYDNVDTWPDAPTSRYFAGTLDDAAVYLTALSAAEVKAHAEAGT